MSAQCAWTASALRWPALHYRGSMGSLGGDLRTKSSCFLTILRSVMKLIKTSEVFLSTVRWMDSRLAIDWKACTIRARAEH